DQVQEEVVLGDEVGEEHRLVRVLSLSQPSLVDAVRGGGQGRYVLRRQRIFDHQQAGLVEGPAFLVGQAVLQTGRIHSSPRVILSGSPLARDRSARSSNSRCR